jgi:phosphatidylglycerol lysyltransferase
MRHEPHASEYRGSTTEAAAPGYDRDTVTAATSWSLQTSLRWLLPVLMSAVMAFAVWRELGHLDLHAIHAVFRRLRLSTTLSLLAGGLGVSVLNASYDLLLTRWLALPLRSSYVMRYAWVAGVLNNVVGFSGMTGSGVRYLALTRAGATTAQALADASLVLFSVPVGLSALATAVLVFYPDALRHSGIPVPMSLTVLAAVSCYWPMYLMMAGSGPLHRRFLADTPALGPSRRFTLFAVSVLDWLVTAMLLWVCLRAAQFDVGPGVTLAAFTLAQALGLISLVPGGLGVFEAAMLVLLHGGGEQTAGLLTGLLLFRVAYYFVPFVFAAQLLPGLPLMSEEGAFNTLLERLQSHPVLRLGRLPLQFFAQLGTRILAYAVFGAGALLLLGAAFPGVTAHLELLDRYAPVLLREGFHLSSVIAGTLLLVLARGIRAGMRSAYSATQVLLLVGALLALLRGIDLEEALLLLTVSMLLRSNRASFTRRGYALTSPRSLRWLAAALAAVALAALLGHLLYGPDRLLAGIIQFGQGMPAATYGRALLSALLTLLAWLGWSGYAMPRPSVALPDRDTLRQVERFYTDVACTSYSYLSFLGDKYIYWPEDGRSLVQYGIRRNHLVALGDPACSDDNRLQAIQQFRVFAADYNLVPVFYQVEEAHLHDYHEAGFRLLKLGESARVPLADFTLKGKEAEKLRGALNRGAREQLAFEVLAQPLQDRLWEHLKAVSDAWLQDRHLAEIGFSLGYFDRDYLARSPIAVVRQAGRIVAFASVVEDFGHGQEYSIDLMRYLPDVPNSTMDYLFVCLMRHAQREGYSWFSLGMAPLSGVGKSPWSPRDERLLQLVYQFGDRFYNYQGLRNYKEKFRPEWRGMYLAYPRGHALAPVLFDVTALITGGYWRALKN